MYAKMLFLAVAVSASSWWSPMSPGHLIRRKRSYEDEIQNSVERPSFEEIMDFGPLAKVPLENKWYDQLCDDQDHNCVDEAAMAAAAPPDPEQEAAEKSKKKAKRDRELKKAMEKGEKRAKKEVEEMGGPDPYRGYFVPHLMDESEKQKKDFFEDFKKANPQSARTTAMSKKWKAAMEGLEGLEGAEEEQGEEGNGDGQERK